MPQPTSPICSVRTRLHKTLLITVSFVVAMVGCQPQPSTPRETVAHLQAAVKDKHFGSVYDLMSADTQIRLDNALQALVKNLRDDDEGRHLFGAPKSKLLQASGRELFERLMKTPRLDQRSWQSAEDLHAATIVDEQTISPTQAQITLKWPTGRTLNISLVQESGVWRVDGRALW